jgi:tRNA-binding EMAP/Myf-like protein
MKGNCESCGCVQDVEYVDGDEEAENRLVFCTVCGDEFLLSPSSTAVASSKYQNYKIGLVMSVEEIPKKSELKKVLVDVSGDGETLIQIVTNAKYVECGWRVVVALRDAIVPAGSELDEDPNAMRVTPTSVGGVKSEGMLCDSWMLNWSGGAKGAIQQIPDSFAIGDSPPSSRPRSE